VPDAQREHTDQGGSAAELVAILAIKRGGEEPDESRASKQTDESGASEERIRDCERAGLRRYRPGPGGSRTARVPAAASLAPEQILDDHIHAIQRALDEHGATERRELATLVGARYWGPGVFRQALREAVADGEIRRTSRTTDDRTDGHEARA